MSGEDLISAVKSGNLSEVQRLVGGNKSIVNWRNKDGYTAFSYACVEGHLEIAQFLVENGANPLLKMIWGHTPLHAAADNNHPSVVRFLISLKLNPFEIYRRRTPRGVAFGKNRTEVASLLEQYEAEFEEKYGREMGLECQDWDEYQRFFEGTESLELEKAIFVDNLPFHKTEDDIAAFFSQAGCPVKSLALFLPADRTEQVQNLGAGYVKFESGADAERAVDTLNGRVMEEEEERKESSSVQEERSLFVCWKSEHEERQEDAKQRADEHNRRLFLQLRELADQASHLAAENAQLREALQLQQQQQELREQHARTEAAIDSLKTELMTKMMSGQLPLEDMMAFTQQLAALQTNPSSDDLQAIKDQLQAIFDRVSEQRN
jgi:DNA repair exonuclease SbcCD ATPase subunit